MQNEHIKSVENKYSYCLTLKNLLRSNQPAGTTKSQTFVPNWKQDPALITQRTVILTGLNPKFLQRIWNVTFQIARQEKYVSYERKEWRLSAGTFFYRKSTIRATIVAVEANNDTYYLQKRIQKFPLCLFLDCFNF